MSEWISCAAEMPDSDLEVMVCDGCGDVYPGFHDGEKWRDITAWPITDTITHWMPYPDPPE